VKPKLLADSFAFVKANNLEVTDDVSMVEQIGKPVKLTMGEYTNIKLTTPEDLGVAEGFLKQRAEGKL
jgi:2-C-methyl-D-erythritol 4-phosphate cytidylyltransferase